MHKKYLDIFYTYIYTEYFFLFEIPKIDILKLEKKWSILEIE